MKKERWINLVFSENNLKEKKMRVHIIGGGNLGSALAIGISKFTKNVDVVMIYFITQQNFY